MVKENILMNKEIKSSLSGGESDNRVYLEKLAQEKRKLLTEDFYNKEYTIYHHKDAISNKELLIKHKIFYWMCLRERYNDIIFFMKKENLTPFAVTCHERT